MHACRHAYIHTHAQPPSHIDTCIHARTHTHTHMHTGVSCAVGEVARAAGGSGSLCVGACRHVAAACRALAARKKTPETKTGALGTASW